MESRVHEFLPVLTEASETDEGAPTPGQPTGAFVSPTTRASRRVAESRSSPFRRFYGNFTSMGMSASRSRRFGVCASSAGGETIQGRLRVGPTRLEDGRGEVGLVDRVGEVLGLEAERLVLLVDDAPLALESSRRGSCRCRTARPARS